MGNNEQFTRQEGILPRAKVEDAEVCIIGVGGLGSFAALALAKLGVKTLHVHDGDSVEVHNVSNQLYSTYHLGLRKVHALADVIGRLMPGTEVICHPYMLEEGVRLPNRVVVSCVDSMEARELIWGVVTGSPSVEYYVDMRAGAEALRVITVMPGEHNADYEETLYSDEEALAAPCTARSIIYTAFFAAGVVAVEVKRWLIGERREHEGITDQLFFCPTLQVFDSNT